MLLERQQALKMKTTHTFDIEHYHNALLPCERFVPQYNYQKGKGLRNIIGNFKRYSIPVINRYVVPHAKNAVYKTYHDILDGSGIRSSIQRNTLGLIQDVGNDVINNLKQKGKGIRTKRLSRQPTSKRNGRVKKTPKKKKVSRKKKVKTTKKKPRKKKSIVTKKDIFS